MWGELETIIALFVVGTVTLSLPTVLLIRWWRGKQRHCFHHELPRHGNNYQSRSYIKSQLIETGKGKLFECDEEVGGCGKVWIV